MSIVIKGYVVQTEDLLNNLRLNKLDLFLQRGDGHKLQETVVIFILVPMYNVGK